MDKIHRRIIDRFKGWAEHHPRVFYPAMILAAILLMLIVTFIVIWLTPQRASAPLIAAPKETPKPVVYYSPLTGVKVKDKKTTERVVTGVMIENSLNSRPQSGLKQAGVVFEAIAEAGITRFLAMYQESKPKIIGPVRSLRMYDIAWFAPFKASIAHVGGSYLSLKKVRNGQFRDIDQFFNSAYYYRATDRWAPHNVYTSTAKLDALNKSKGYKTSKFTGWARTDEEPTGKPARVVNVEISGPSYDLTYKYHKKSDTYVRYMGGGVHRDRELGNIAPKVVIAMDVIENTVFEDGWRENIKTTGSGRVRIFQGGVVTVGKWVKKGMFDQLRFVDKKGEEIPLLRGQTWITAVPANRGKEVTWQK